MASAVAVQTLFVIDIDRFQPCVAVTKLEINMHPHAL
jgi:hypothetical protein